LAHREVNAVTLHGELLLLPQLAIDIASTSNSISPTA